MKNVIVISLGGSLIIQDKINLNFLNDFKKILIKNKDKYKFVVVCGGGKTARNYMQGLESLKNKKEYFQSLIGIASTRLNARLLTYFFGKESHQGIPTDMKQIKNLLMFNDIVFCGALRYAQNQTSDSTSAKLARFFNTEFINITDVNGLYDKNPKEFNDAKFIAQISHKEFTKITKKIRFRPGQHFILDQTAAKIIDDYNITTFIIGRDMKNLGNLLNKKHFIGTIIEN